MLQSEVDVTQLTFWFDARIAPSVAKWIIETYKVKAACLRRSGLRDARNKYERLNIIRQFLRNR